MGPSLAPAAILPVLTLPPISLAELQLEAAFLTRRDRKYVVAEDRLPELIEGLEAGTRALEIDGQRSFGYATRYFDDAHTAYLRALRKRSNRFKVRTRLYEERGECLLEVKVLDARGWTVKSRLGHDPAALDALSPLDRAWLQSFEAVRSVAARLETSVATRYHRSTLVFPGGSGRMTIDQELTFVGVNGMTRRLDGFCVIEIKGHGRPLPFDRLLWLRGHRPVPASKFALGVCLTDPEVPDNRWHRLRTMLEPSLLTA
jgi:hypothetical protein